MFKLELKWRKTLEQMLSGIEKMLRRDHKARHQNEALRVGAVNPITQGEQALYQAMGWESLIEEGVEADFTS